MAALPHGVGGAEQDVGPFGGRCAAPDLEGLHGGVQSGIYVLDIGHGKGPDNLVGPGRVHGVEGGFGVDLAPSDAHGIAAAELRGHLVQRRLEGVAMTGLAEVCERGVFERAAIGQGLGYVGLGHGGIGWGLGTGHTGSGLFKLEGSDKIVAPCARARAYRNRIARIGFTRIG